MIWHLYKTVDIAFNNITHEASNTLKNRKSGIKKPSNARLVYSIGKAKIYATSNKPAAPIPPPIHIEITTYLTPRRLPSSKAWPTIRAPDIPNG